MEKEVEGYAVNFVCPQEKDHAFPQNLNRADGMTITDGDLRRVVPGESVPPRAGDFRRAFALGGAERQLRFRRHLACNVRARSERVARIPLAPSISSRATRASSSPRIRKIGGHSWLRMSGISLLLHSPRARASPASTRSAPRWRRPSGPTRCSPLCFRLR